MPYYYVNQNQQSSGDHEVHTRECTHGANAVNKLPLGFHETCQPALREAKKRYPSADGCYYCCNACHKR